MKRIETVGLLALLLTGCLGSISRGLGNVSDIFERPERYLFQPNGPATVVDGVCQVEAGNRTIRFAVGAVERLVSKVEELKSDSDAALSIDDVCPAVLSADDFYRAFYKPSNAPTAEGEEPVINARQIERVAKGGSKGETE